MSITSLYRLGRDPAEIAEFRNAWRGAMYVWTDMAKRYWGLPSFPFTDAECSKVWNTHLHHSIPEHERIVLLSTMDNAVVYGRDAKITAEAFERYGREHPNSSFIEQAEALRSPEIEPDDVLAWQQTSVGDFWGMGWDADKDEPSWYDPATETKHFDVIAAAKGH